jgi:DNA repair exonuclease SbcCD nuclease subunit
MKIALITDTHFGARGDSLLFLDYMMEFYNNVFFPTLEERGIDTVIHLGDIVDRRKFINFNILNCFKNEFIGRLQQMKINTHIIVGNHDTYFKNTNKINAMDLLGDFNHEYAPKIYSEPKVVNFDGTDILMLPWINSGNYVDSMQTIKDCTVPYCMGHLELAGFEFLAGVECEDGMPIDTFSHFKKVMTGHFHHKSHKNNIDYLGNPYELTWSDYNDKRGFHVFDTDTGELEFIVNPFRMFHKIYYNSNFDTTDFTHLKGKFVKVIVEEKGNPVKFDVFLDNLYKSDVADVSVLDDDIIIDADELDNEDNVEDTMGLLSNYIDNYELDLDKTKLKSLMRELYQDALRGGE